MSFLEIILKRDIRDLEDELFETDSFVHELQETIKELRTVVSTAAQEAPPLSMIGSGLTNVIGTIDSDQVVYTGAINTDEIQGLWMN